MKGKVAIITGASSGIGKATAEAFAAKGINVVVAARRKTALDELVQKIEDQGGSTSAIQTDVSKSEEVQRMVQHAMDVYGQIDYAINNAGIEGEFNPIIDLE